MESTNIETAPSWESLYNEERDKLRTLRNRYETLSNRHDDFVKGIEEILKEMESTLVDSDYEEIMKVVEEMLGQYIDLPEKEVEFSATFTVRIDGTASISRGKDYGEEITSMLEYEMDADSFINGYEITVSSADAEIDSVDIDN